MAGFMMLVLFLVSDGNALKCPTIVRQCLEESRREEEWRKWHLPCLRVATDIQALKTVFDTSECPSNLCCFFLHKSYVRHIQSASLVADLSLCLFSVTDNKDVSVMMSEMDVNAIAGRSSCTSGSS